MSGSTEVRKASVVLRGRGSRRNMRVIRYAFSGALERLSPMSCTATQMHFQQRIEDRVKIRDGRQ